MVGGEERRGREKGEEGESPCIGDMQRRQLKYEEPESYFQGMNPILAKFRQNKEMAAPPPTGGRMAPCLGMGKGRKEERKGGREEKREGGRKERREGGRKEGKEGGRKGGRKERREGGNGGRKTRGRKEVREGGRKTPRLGVGEEPLAKEDPPSPLSQDWISSRSGFPQIAPVSPVAWAGIGNRKGVAPLNPSGNPPWRWGGGGNLQGREAHLQPREARFLARPPDVLAGGCRDEHSWKSWLGKGGEKRGKESAERAGPFGTEGAQAAPSPGEEVWRGGEDPTPVGSAYCKGAAPTSCTDGRALLVLLAKMENGSYKNRWDFFLISSS
ncbi:uncharacterized protein LOC131204194 [Ahaetulla prasina]|uniref:uncharacterized protein LOC131204194 n=1 Tax=Ahaetulla prasina TaxID=499056 RepID=UPI0026479CEA|nr:uncharacterized protein LOC131204194 [Ahaetulla prasina]